MKILYNVLAECGYAEKGSVPFTYQWKGAEVSRVVSAYASARYPDDVYLLGEIPPAELEQTLSDDFLPALAQAFRKQSFHRSSMDRNTTLVLGCRYEKIGQLPHTAKVQLEDDPYYFKKYVFAYTKAQEDSALAWLLEHRDCPSMLEAIRGCLLDTEQFAGYKASADAQKAYAYFVELATKVTVLPICPNNDEPIKPVQEYWEEALLGAPQLDPAALEQILELDPDRPDEMLDSWIRMTRPVQA